MSGEENLASQDSKECYSLLLELEKEYKLLLSNKKISVCSDLASRQRKRVLDQFITLVKLDADLVTLKSVESTMWKLLYYSEIVRLRKDIATDSTVEVVYAKFLQEALNTFKEFVSDICIHYGLKQLRFLCHAAFLIEKKPPKRRASETTKLAALKVAHQLLIYMGDIARYFQQLPKKFSSRNSSAILYYDIARRLFPCVGLCFNQLAVVKSPKDALVGLEYYIRAVCAQQPFPVAKNNAKALFKQFLSGQLTVSAAHIVDKKKKNAVTETQRSILKFFATLQLAKCSIDYVVLAEETAGMLQCSDERTTWSALISAMGMLHLQLTCGSFLRTDSSKEDNALVSTALTVFILASVPHWLPETVRYVQKNHACESFLSIVRVVLLWLLRNQNVESFVQMLNCRKVIVHSRNALKAIVASLISKKKANLKQLLGGFPKQVATATITTRDICGFVPVWTKSDIAVMPQARLCEELGCLLREAQAVLEAYNWLLDGNLELQKSEFYALFTQKKELHPKDVDVSISDEEILFVGSNVRLTPPDPMALAQFSTVEKEAHDDVEALIRHHLPSSLFDTLFEDSSSNNLLEISKSLGKESEEGTHPQVFNQLKSQSIWAHSSSEFLRGTYLKR